jgi:hypothetical protein
LLAAILHDGGGPAEDFDALGGAEPGIAIAEQGIGRGKHTLVDTRPAGPNRR